jgi:hypothetical protein
MVYIIIVVVILIIISPIIANLPNARQKQQMQMRKQAMAAGINIDLTHIDDPDPNPDDYLSSTGKPLPRVMAVFAYRMPRRRSEANYHKPPSQWRLVRRAGPAVPGLPAAWQWQDTDPAQLSLALRQFLETRIADLPADVNRLEEEKFIISAYWRESDEGAGLTKLIDFLKDCAALDAITDGADRGVSNDHRE